MARSGLNPLGGHAEKAAELSSMKVLAPNPCQFSFVSRGNKGKHFLPSLLAWPSTNYQALEATENHLHLESTSTKLLRAEGLW